MHHRLTTAIAAALVFVACQGKLFTITIEESSTTVVEEGTLLEDLVDDFGFGGFLDMNIVASEELANQGVEPGDIDGVFLTELSLEVLDPSDGDLAFIDQLDVYVQADGLPAILVASQDTFPEGEGFVPLDLEDVDLTEYVVSESMDLVTDVTGHRPSDTTEIEAAFALEVGVTKQGACNQLKKDEE